MELKLIQRLVQIMRRGEVTELEIDDTTSGLHVRLKRGPETGGQQAPVVHVTQGGGAMPMAMGMPMVPGAPLAAGPAPGEAAEPAEPAGTPFLSPMVGTFYRAASPEAEAFADVGTELKPDSVICILEAMKVMNEIKAEITGKVVEVLVENGEPVEFGQPLFLVEER